VAYWLLSKARITFNKILEYLMKKLVTILSLLSITCSTALAQSKKAETFAPSFEQSSYRNYINRPVVKLNWIDRNTLSKDLSFGYIESFDRSIPIIRNQEALNVRFLNRETTQVNQCFDWMFLTGKKNKCFMDAKKNVACVGEHKNLFRHLSTKKDGIFNGVIIGFSPINNMWLSLDNSGDIVVGPIVSSNIGVEGVKVGDEVITNKYYLTKNNETAPNSYWNNGILEGPAQIQHILGLSEIDGDLVVGVKESSERVGFTKCDSFTKKDLLKEKKSAFLIVPMLDGIRDGATLQQTSIIAQKECEGVNYYLTNLDLGKISKDLGGESKIESGLLYIGKEENVMQKAGCSGSICVGQKYTCGKYESRSGMHVVCSKDLDKEKLKFMSLKDSEGINNYDYELESNVNVTVEAINKKTTVLKLENSDKRIAVDNYIFLVD
jgi:hypothetical protein